MTEDSGTEDVSADPVRDELTKHDVEPDLADRPIGEGIRERLTRTALKRRATMNAVLGVLSIPFWIYVMYMSLSGASRAMFGIGFLGGILLLYIYSELADNVGGGTNYILDDLKTLLSEHRLDVAILSVCAVITVITTVYMYTNVLRLLEGGRVTTPELAMAAAFSVVVIYLTWRAFGITFLAVVLVGIAYGLFGWVIPGTLGHTGISARRTLRILALGNDGFFGFLTQLTAAWIALFLLYAGMLRAYGAFDLILRAAVRAAKYVDSGVAQTAVIASAVIGSVNGSQTANAGMTGSFTIPMMKEGGVRGSTAGGIESVASTTGQVLPPVMGAGAFVMAQLITGVSYLDVIVAGLIPAAIMMIVIAVAVHYAAAPQIEDPEMSGHFENRLTQTELVLEGIKFGVPLFVLIYFLGFLGYTVMTSAFFTVVTMAAFGIAIPTSKAAYDSRNVRVTFWQFVDTLKQTFNGLRGGVVVLAPVAIILGAINGVVDILTSTGVPGQISLTLMSLSGGVLIVAAVMAMAICIVLGLGMPTTAAYTIVALLIAPTLINQFFLPEFSAHFFVFYAAILAGLTPPIATCVAVACSIAGSDFWETCFEAIKISAPLFILPFSFIYHPVIVDHGGEFTASVLLSGAIILAGALIIIHGLNYRFDLDRAPALGLRGVFFSLGVVVMVYPGQMVQLGALGVATFLYLTQAAVGETSPLDRLRSIAR